MAYHQRFKAVGQRFDEKYHVSPRGCWLWNNCRDGEYPKFWLAPKHVKASHYAWQRANGRSLRPGEQILHHCDTPRCVNPAHLFVGDASANMRDRSLKGRFDIRGTKNGRAIVNEQIADEMRRAYRAGGVSQSDLAQKFGVGQTTVSAIVRGARWPSPTSQGET